jgi:hypothetical protein
VKPSQAFVVKLAADAAPGHGAPAGRIERNVAAIRDLADAGTSDQKTTIGGAAMTHAVWRWIAAWFAVLLYFVFMLWLRRRRR